MHRIFSGVSRESNVLVVSPENGGWDNDTREIHLIPEIRRFYSTFHDAWPYWLYFRNLDVDVLRAMVMCCMPSIEAMQVDGSPEVKVT